MRQTSVHEDEQQRSVPRVDSLDLEEGVAVFGSGDEHGGRDVSQGVEPDDVVVWAEEGGVGVGEVVEVHACGCAVAGFVYGHGLGDEG